MLPPPDFFMHCKPHEVSGTQFLPGTFSLNEIASARVKRDDKTVLARRFPKEIRCHGD